MKKIKILTITLIIILITMVAFFGVYVQVQNRLENGVKDYSYAMDLYGTRNLELEVSEGNNTIIKDSEGKVVSDAKNLTDEEIAQKGYVKEEIPYNVSENKNIENYNNSKQILEKRLKKLGVNEYIIKMDEQTGKIFIEVEENENSDNIVSNLNISGKFEIVDTQTQEVLMDNNDIKLSNVMYSSESTTGSNGTSVYLNIEFTKDGAKKLEDITTKYVKSTDTQNSENTTTENEATDDTKVAENTITMKIDNEDIMSTSFDEPLKTGKLQLSVGTAATDDDTLQGYIKQASSMAIVLDNGNMPLKYDIVQNQFVYADMVNNQLQTIKYIILSLIIIALAVLIIRYKMLGILGAISYIGLVSAFLLILRYANVVISLEGIFGIAITLTLNYIFINKILSKLKEKNKDFTVQDVKVANKETYKEFFIKIIPIIIMVISFSFINWIHLSSFGMVMFWGIMLIAVYNIIITNTLLKIKAK